MPLLLTIFGAKPPQTLLNNISEYYLYKQTKGKAVSASKLGKLVTSQFSPVDYPEAKSNSGYALLFTGFSDMCSAGRKLEQSDFDRLNAQYPGQCNATVDGNGDQVGLCLGRKALITPYTLVQISL